MHINEMPAPHRTEDSFFMALFHQSIKLQNRTKHLLYDIRTNLFHLSLESVPQGREA
jgi:hypothetical protein